MRKVLFFHSDHCGLCRAMNESLVKPLRLRGVTVCSIDVMNNKQAALAYRIKKLPTTIVLDHDGEVYSRFEGFADLQTVSNQAQDYNGVNLTGTYDGEGSVNKLA